MWAAPSLTHASPGSHPAPEACFQVVNSAGDAHGNCGQDTEGSFVPCAQRWREELRFRKLGSGLGAGDIPCCLTTLYLVPRDAQCGKLQCQGGEQSPLAPHTMPVDSTFSLGSHEVTCRGTFLLPSAQLDLHDLGLVEPGTQCGSRMVSPDLLTSPPLESYRPKCYSPSLPSDHHCP